MFGWAANTGRIYVPVTEKMAPDANLSYLPERDVSTPSGHQFTLISPPMIMSQVHALPGEHSRLQGHITSLTPIRPQDTPDPWEKEAFEAFAEGRKQIEAEETISGQRYFRLMRPFGHRQILPDLPRRTGIQGGDIHGGLSIAVPMASIWGEQMPDVIHRIVGYGGMWIVGLIGIALMSRRLGQEVSQRYEAEQKLQEAHICSNGAWPSAPPNWPPPIETLRTKSRNANRPSSGCWKARGASAAISSKVWWAWPFCRPNRIGWKSISRLCQMLGYQEEELFAKTWSQLVHQEESAAVELQFQRLLNSAARAFVIDTRLLAKGGRTLPVGLSGQCLKKPDGSVDCLLVLVQELRGHGQS